MGIEKDEGPSLRETLASAMGASDAGEGAGDDSGDGAVLDGGVSNVLDATAATGSEAPDAGDGSASDAAPSGEGRARGADGKFIPKAAVAKTPTPKPGATSQAAPAAVAAKPNATVAPTQGAATSTADIKAPQAWKPAAREDWAKVPASVQAEVNRRERETAVALQEAAESRKLQQSFQQTVAPYQAMIQQAGADPMAVVQSFFKTAHALSYAPAPHKAEVVAHLIRSYGVDIPTLAAVLDGQPAPRQQQPQAVDPRTIAAQVRQEVLQSIQQQRQQSTVQRASQEVEQFSQGREFFDDVRDTMADLMEVSARRGVPISYEDAYNRALKLDPDISKVLEQREAAKLATNAQASTQRARAAASSIKSTPAGPVSGPQPDDIRGALTAAFAAHSGR